MNSSDSLGEFEQSVLLAIAHLGAGTYGVPIRAFLEERLGRPVAIGALYTALERLERKGYLKSRMSEPTAERGGRSRRQFQLQPAGTAALKRSRAVLARLWSGLDANLRPERQR